MSRLAELIRRAARDETPPMGFAARANWKPAPRMLTVATGPAEDADLLLLAAPASAKQQTPWGVTVRDAAGYRAAREAGADFVCFAMDDLPAQVLLDEEPGRVLVLDQDTPDALLRMVEGLGVDACYVERADGPLTVRAAAELRRIAGLTRRPLLLPATVAPDTGELGAARECGVVGLVVPPVTAAAVRERIAAVPARKPRREERPMAVLPHAGFAPANEEEEDDEDRLR